jgi:hypothetical protein
MKVSLSSPLRIETAPVDGRMVTRVFSGSQELAATPEVLEAVTRFARGAAADLELLSRIGVLQPTAVDAIPDEAVAVLHPRVALDLDLRPGRVQLPGPTGPRRTTVLPEGSLPISCFIPAYRLWPLQHLAATLQRAWFAMLRGAHGRGRQLDLDRAAELLAAVAAEEARDPAVQPVVEWDPSARRFEPLVKLQDDTFHYPLSGILARSDREAALSRGRPSSRVNLDPNVDLPAAEAEMVAMSTFVGRLANGATMGELRARVAAGPPSLGVLWTALLAAQQVVPAPPPQALAPLRPGEIVFFGHATLYANLGGLHVLVDPWLPPASAADPVTAPSLPDLPALDAVFFTHHHWDHVNPETLLRLDKRLPIYFPAPRSGALVPRLDRFLQAFGFTHLHPLATGAEVALGDGGRVVACPFYGEDPARTGFAGATYALVQDGRAAFVHVDSGTDALGRSLVTDGALDHLRARFGPVSPVFATRRQERTAQVEHGFEFLLRPADEWVRPAENCDNDAAFLAALARAAGGQLVLYSEGGASWYPAGTDFLRRGPATAMDACRELGWDDLAAVQRSTGAHLAAPYHRFRVGEGEAGSVAPPRREGRS